MDMMSTCDSIWVVTKIDRAITDTSVDSLLYRYGKEYNMAVICTGIDDNIDPALATYLRSEGQSVGEHDDLLQRERYLHKLVALLPRKIEARVAKLAPRGREQNNKRQRSLSHETREKLQSQLLAYETELEKARAELAEVAHARFELLVDARNSNAIRRLQEEKSSHLPFGTTLDVFCVSNVHYAALKGARVISGPRLKVQSTGIPALREYVLRRAAPFQLQAVEDFTKHKCMGLLQGLSMFAKTYSVKHGDELLKVIKASNQLLSRPTETYVAKILDANNTFNAKPLLDAREELATAAISELEKKRSWHWSTTRAFIRKDGNHITNLAPRQSWNEQFQAEATRLLSEKWDGFLTEQKDLSAGLQKDLLGLIHSIRHQLEGMWPRIAYAPIG